MLARKTAGRWLHGDFDTLPFWLETKLRNRVDASFERAWRRLPLVPPGTEGRAADSYVRAAELALEIEVDSIYEADEVIEGDKPLSEARSDFQQLARSETAAEIAGLLAEGASCTDGKSPLPLPSYGISFGLPGGFPVILLQRLIGLHAISLHDDGEVDQCVRVLLSEMRFLQDLARGTYTDALAVSLGGQVAVGRLMRRLAQEKGPTDSGFQALLSGYGRLLETEVPLHQVVINEGTSRLARILAVHCDVPYSFPRPRWRLRNHIQSFVIMRTNKEVAKMVRSAKADNTRMQRFVHRTGGLEQDLRRMDETEALWEEYSTLAGLSLAERLEFIRAGVSAICGPDGVPQGTGHSALSAETRQTAIRATYIHLALMYFKKKTGKPPTSLDELLPTIIPSLPTDAISGGAFKYQAEGQGFSLKSGTYTANKDALMDVVVEQMPESLEPIQVACVLNAM